MTGTWNTEIVLCNIIVITLKMPGSDFLLWGTWLTDSLSGFLQHPPLLPSQAGFAWTAPSQPPFSAGLLIQACSCKEWDSWNRWLCLQDSPSAWWKLQQPCTAVWNAPFFLSSPLHGGQTCTAIGAAPFFLQAPLCFPISWSLLKFLSVELLILSHSLPPPSFASSLAQHQGLFQ